MTDQAKIEAFIARWTASVGGAERANYALFLSELCDVLGVDHPNPAGADGRNDYTFERPVKPRESAETTAPKRIDLYKRDCFILEAKQSRLPDAKNALPGQATLFKEETPRGSRTAVRGWDVMMRNARKQAEGYVFLLDAEHKAPPFIIVCDVGHCFELYADFTGTGRAYTQFPDRNGYRIFLEDLRDEKCRERLKAIWTNPHSLDPTKNAVRVTREIAARLAAVSKALEETGANAEDVAHFLMRCLFTMFAEDVDLIPKKSFQALLEKCIERPETFTLRLKQLWSEMEKGAEFSHVIETRVKHFNGGLFKNTTAFELGREQIGELLVAARAEWNEVDPAIFGTLLEQALDPDERRKLGAHYTPRAYVQRLVEVTVMEPLRADWEAALTKAELAKEDGKDADAIRIVREFHNQLCHTRVLDPACGTGNFLYVALELMKQLEGEVLETLTKLGDEQGLLTLKNLTVDPHLFLGLELNPRAAAIAELVVWIGYLQWHYRNTKGHPEEPILRAFDNIRCMDAVLTWDGYPTPGVAERDGKRVLTYPNARSPAWPEADFIVGNPPFSGVRLMRSTLGSSYVDALRTAYPNVPETSDYVLYWWHRAAILTASRSVIRFGLITTNSVTQAYSQRLLRHHLNSPTNPLQIVFAIPDHPWIDTKDGANVRVAMTVGQAQRAEVVFSRIGVVAANTDVIQLHLVTRVNETLSLAPGVVDAVPMQANEDICFQGVVPAGRGFKLSSSEAALLGGGTECDRIRPYVIGKDLVQHPQQQFIIDLFGCDQSAARTQYPRLYQHLLQTVEPERRQNAREQYRRLWWIFAEPRPAMREALSGLPRYIGTPYTAKHRPFVFIEENTLPDAMVYAVAHSNASMLAVLSSKHHAIWSLESGGTLEDRPRYNKARTFDLFPFPHLTEPLNSKLSSLGEELDTTRKRVQAEHPDITLTGLYNVLEKVKAGAELTPQEEDVKTRGLVLVIKDLHDQIDNATAEAYGWSADLSDEQILEKLVALNADRAREEAQGFVRWLRPEYQEPRFGKQAPAQKTGDLDLEEKVVAIDKDLPTFPKDRYEQPLAIEAALAAHAQPLDAAGIAKLFKGKATDARAKRIAEVLTTLARYGRIIALDNGTYAARRAA